MTYNGHELTEFYPERTAVYVEQEDQHMPELTVRETFNFSACCQGAGSNAGAPQISPCPCACPCYARSPCFCACRQGACSACPRRTHGRGMAKSLRLSPWLLHP